MSIMKSVKKLPPEVCSVIRSGVIIPTPTQGVVELILNSIDANASSIAIRIDLKLFKFQVIDNGNGIAFPDLDIIGNRSVTSKCYSLEEYYNNLMYHGYRGEALASMCEMSGYMEIVTRSAEDDVTYKKLFVHGKAQPTKVSDLKRPTCGTTVTITDFMYNMQVRRSRLKEPLELEAIRTQIECIALAHPEVSFSLRNDTKGRVIMEKHKSTDMLNAFEHLFGHTLSRTLSIINFSSSKFKINGFISKESYRHNDLQFIYVNKKPIIKSKLHKFVSALLAKSSIIRCNGTWKNKPIPKHIPAERWLSFPSLEKVKKFPVFVMNVTCARNEYEICWDSRKPSIYFKDWDGILACMSESIQTFLKTENLVDEEDYQEEQEERIDDKKCGDDCDILLPKNDPLTSEQKVETWNMQGAVHGITAKRIKRSKQNKNLLMENGTNHYTISLKHSSVTPNPSSSNSTNDVNFYDTINSVPPVVKFLGKIETPELVRLKITRGAYHLKMMEEEHKKQKIANKLGKFKFACKPKLCNSIVNNKNDKKKTLLSSKASDYTNGNNTINLDEKLIKNRVQLKTVGKLDKETLTHSNNASDISCVMDRSIGSTSSAVLIDKNKMYLTSESEPQFPPVSLKLSPDRSIEDLIASDHNSVFSGLTSHSHLAACYGNDTKKVENKRISHFKFSRKNKKDINVLSLHKPISIMEETDSNNCPEIHCVHNVPLNKDTRIKSSTHNNNSNNFKPGHSASPKINSKCSKLGISKTTLISIETPQININHTFDKTHIISPFFAKRTSLLDVHEVEVDNDECLKISDVSIRNSSLPEENASIGRTCFREGEHSFHLEVSGNKDFYDAKQYNFKSSFNSLFEILEGESSKESPINKPESNLENYSCNEGTSVNKLSYANMNHESKTLIVDHAPVYANTPKGCSVINVCDRNNVSGSNQFFETFENSILHTNSTTMKSSPYFSTKYKTKHNFDCFCNKTLEKENSTNKTGTAELDSTSILEKLKGSQLTEELSLNRSNLTKVNLKDCHRDIDNSLCFEKNSFNLCSPKSIDKEKSYRLENVNSLVDVTTLESSGLSPSTNTPEDYIECKRMRLSEGKVETGIFLPTKNLSNFNTQSKKMKTEEIFDQKTVSSHNAHNIVQTKVSANEVIDEVKDMTSLQNMDSKEEKMEVGTNLMQYGKMDEEAMKDWQAFKNFEGKHFYVHIASGFTSFKSPDVEKQNNLYGMSKRFEFIPKGMSPILAAHSTLNHTLKPITQHPNEQCVEWNSDTIFTEKNDLKTVKWRDKTDFMNNDISDLLDTAKANSEKKIMLNCSTIPDLSFMGAKMSRLLHEEKYDKCVFSNIQVIGQLDNKFIVTLFSSDKTISPHVLGLFDQHAVHERIRLETLMKEYSEYEDKHMKFKAMKLDEPLKLEVGSKELCIADSFKNKFENLGLYFTIREESIEFQKIPSCLHARYLRERSMQWLKTAVRNVIQDVVLDLINSGGLDPIPPEVYRDVINSEACKGAIKFGDPLSLEQCEELLFYLSMCDLPFFCAHGRPSFMPLFDLRSFESERKVYISK